MGRRLTLTIPDDIYGQAEELAQNEACPILDVDFLILSRNSWRGNHGKVRRTCMVTNLIASRK